MQHEELILLDLQLNLLAGSNWASNFSEELDQLLEDAPSPFIMQHAARITSVRKRVSSLNAVLRSIQRRVDNIDRMLFVGLPHGILIILYWLDDTVS